MEINQTDIANIRLKLGGNVSDNTILSNLIEVDKKSQAKKNMTDGVNYYLGKNDILKHDFRIYHVLNSPMIDYDHANNRLAHSFLKLLVLQKAGYLVGNPLTVTTNPESMQEQLTEFFGEQFADKLNDWVTGASVKGKEFIHPYYNSRGEFKYTILDSREIIPIYDNAYESELIEFIRYYYVDYVIDNKTEKRIKAEWWTSNDVTFYFETEQGKLVEDASQPINPRPHYMVGNSTSKQLIGRSWGRVPLVELANNSDKTTDLEPIKSLIDDYDFNTSDLSNNLSDLQDAIWILMGYDGEKLSDFRNNLKTNKVIKVDEGGSAEPKVLDIPIAARDSQLDRLKKDIYAFGMGVNVDNEKFGDSPSGVALQFLFSFLDLKAKQLERKLQQALQDLSWFVITSIGKNPDNVKINFVFDYSMLVNESEIIDNLQKSVGLIPEEIILAKHPYVDNLDDALALMQEQNSIDLTQNDNNNI